VLTCTAGTRTTGSGNAKSPADGPGANPAAGLIDPSMTAIDADEEATMPYLSE
jgi:hypothetical protein